IAAIGQRGGIAVEHIASGVKHLAVFRIESITIRQNTKASITDLNKCILKRVALPRILNLVVILFDVTGSDDCVNSFSSLECPVSSLMDLFDPRNALQRLPIYDNLLRPIDDRMNFLRPTHGFSRFTSTHGTPRHAHTAPGQCAGL